MSDRVAADPRFAKIGTDARFKRARKHAEGVDIDGRFATGLFEDARFAVSAAKVDKTGRRVAARKSELKDFYGLAENEVDDGDDGVSAFARQGLDGPSSSSSSSSSSASSSCESDSEVAAGVELEEQQLAFLRGGGAVDVMPESEPATARLAIVNLDWDYVGAVDILVMLNSFCPAQGSITRVSVYPSQFGRERMAREDLSGPTLVGAEAEPPGELSEEKRDQLIRKYEMERLLYYFGVIECDSPQTAFAIYSACDGADFGESGNVIDLRFVPDDQRFDDAARDTATSVPHAYEPPDFETDALTQSKVAIRWDVTPADRLRVTMRERDPTELRDDDFAAFLASSGSEASDAQADVDGIRVDGDAEADRARSERAKRKVRERYSSLLEGIQKPSDNKGGKDDEDMIITFQSGLQSNDADEQRVIDEADLTLMEKRRLAKARKKKERRERQPVDAEEAAAPVVEDDSAGDEAQQRELELLVMDDRKKGFKVKRSKRGDGDDDGADAVNVDDDRFAALWSRPEFAIDKTDQRFKATQSMQRLLERVREKRDRERGRLQIEQPAANDMARLVQRVKAKAQRHHK